MASVKGRSDGSFSLYYKPSPEPGVWALKKNNLGKRIKSLIISSHTEISRSSETTHKLWTQADTKEC